MLTLDEMLAELRAQPYDGSGLLPQAAHGGWQLGDVVHEVHNLVPPLRARLRSLATLAPDEPTLRYFARCFIAIDRLDAMAAGITRTLESTP